MSRRRRLVLGVGVGLTLATALGLGSLVSPEAGLLVVLLALCAATLAVTRRGAARVLAHLRTQERRERARGEAQRDELRAARDRTAAEHQVVLQRLAALDQRSTELARSLEHLQQWVQDPEGSRERAATAKRASSDVGPAPLVAGADVFEALDMSGAQASVVLVLHSLHPDQLFAGIKTALVTGLKSAQLLKRPLRIVVMTPMPASPQAIADRVRVWTSQTVPHLAVPDLEVVALRDVPAQQFSRDDVWIATYWSTAHVIGGAVRTGRVDTARVLYLIQDYEPGFYAWGTPFALASDTYRAGFTAIVNSRSLAHYLALRTGAPVDPAHVFRPDIDKERLAASAALWRPPPRSGEVRVLAYGRPTKPRNMFDLSVRALRRWVHDLPDDVRPVVRSAGEEHDPVDLGRGCVMEPLGKLSLDAYYDVLTRTDLGLALMHSPHPGHLSLELPMSGIPTVTNAFEGSRVPWVEGLEVADATPGALGLALGRAHRRAADQAVHTFVQPHLDLGRPLDDVLDTVLAAVAPRS